MSRSELTPGPNRLVGTRLVYTYRHAETGGLYVRIEDEESGRDAFVSLNGARAAKGAAGRERLPDGLRDEVTGAVYSEPWETPFILLPEEDRIERTQTILQALAVHHAALSTER